MVLFDAYLDALKKSDRTQITEHTHRKDLQLLLESIAAQVNPKITIIHEPKRLEEYGAPDFKITFNDMIIGYVENKKPGEKLDEVLKSDQIKRYKSLSDNIILTDYLEWIWLKDGKIADRKALCYVSDLDKHRFKVDEEKAKQVQSLLEKFFSITPEGIAHPKKLATALATRAHLLKEYIWEELLRQSKEDNEGRLFGLFSTFKKLVDHELTLEEFTDTFAQMLVYGLFMARLNSGSAKIDLYNVEKFIPTSFELIRELVSFLKELEKPEYSETRWIVEEVLTVLNTMDSQAIHAVLSFNPVLRKGKKVTTDASSVVQSDTIEANVYTAKDPYIYFYEDFLAAYDKKLRKAKGVYYTPLPVVNFIVRAINDVLKDTFGIADGLADHKKVTVLDFACGTGTFILEIVRQILDAAPPAKHDLLIKEHILKNIYGFEYMMAPYTVAHLKLSQYLKDKGYELSEDEHINVFLTNTLENIKTQKDYLLPALSKESAAAHKIKDKPILVITGNPPYFGESKNKGPWILELIKDYNKINNVPLGEKVAKWLQNDYVKFIRFAQWKMDQVEEGIVAIITSNTFLDSPTFRGMRWSLMQTFNMIYILDLHGSSMNGVKITNGIIDENVFDIKQGVAISIFIKTGDKTKKIFRHADIIGLRNDKYFRLTFESLKSNLWSDIEILPSKYIYHYLDKVEYNSYDKYIKITDLFNISGSGIVTKRDFLTIQDTEESVIQSLYDIENLQEVDFRIKYKLPDDVRDWRYEWAKKDIKNTGVSKQKVKSIHYRPFDVRKIYYTGKSRGFVGWPVEKIMKHMFEDNIGIVCSRQCADDWKYIFISDKIIEFNLTGTAGSFGSGFLFPLYLYEEVDFLGTKQLEKKPNIKAEVINSLTAKYKQQAVGAGLVPALNKKGRHETDPYAITPEQIMSYIYAVLHSPTYRTKYADFLKTDFPRIPFSDDYKIFIQLSELGWDLINAHLQKKPQLHKVYRGMGDFAVKGTNLVDKVLYTEAQSRLYINADQYFGKLPETVFNFYIGGYQVLHKYLKDRKGRTLTLDEINNVELIAKTLQFTLDQMQKIDEQTKEWI